MFMTNYELIYGEYKGTSGNSSSPVHREQPAPQKEKGKGAETAVKAAKAVVGAHIAAAKFAGGAVSKLSKKAVDYAKSDDAAEKAAFAKEKAGAAFAGLKGKAAALAADRKKAVDGDTPDDEGFADENFPVEEAYSESDIVRDTADYNEEESDAESFDELYKKAMNTAADDEESYDEAASLETDTEDSYNEETVNEVKEPVDAPSVDPSPAPPTSTQPKPAPRQFSYEDEKKSPVIFVLVGVIAVLLVGMGILGGMLLMKNKDNNGSDNSSNDEIITTTTEEKSNEANTASAQAVTSEITAQSQEIITTSEATTEASKGEKVDTSDAVKRALIAHLDKEFANEKSQEYYYFDRDVKYAVYDVNADGIDELFISYDTTASHNTDVYIYKNNDYVLTEQVWEGGISVCLEEQFLFVQQYGGATVTRILNIYDGNLVQTDELRLSASSYTHNGISITQNEYDKLLSNYQSKEMIELWNNTKPVSELIDISSYQKSNTQQKYTVYDTSAAGSDFSFNNEPYSRKVRTESGNLNLRAAPSTSAEIIIEMPKDSSISLWGVNSEWAYVSYTVNGTTYYGYASNQYIGVP